MPLLRKDDDSGATPVVSPISTSVNAGDGAVRVRVADWKVRGRSSSSSAEDVSLRNATPECQGVVGEDDSNVVKIGEISGIQGCIRHRPADLGLVADDREGGIVIRRRRARKVRNRIRWK